MKRKRLIWQIFPSYLAIAVVSVMAVAWYSSGIFRRFHYDRTERELRSAAYLVTEQLRTAAGQLDTPATDVLCDSLGTAAGYRITVTLPSGRVVGDSEKDPATMDNHADRPEISRAMRGVVGTESRYSDTLSTEMLYVAVPLLSDGRSAGVVRASLSLAEIEEALNLMWYRLSVAVLVLAGLAAFATMVVARRISRPLAEVRVGAEDFGRGNLEGRLAPSDVVEIDVLAETMNRMADQLSERIRAVTRQRDEQEALLSCMVEAVLAVDNDKSLIRLNRAAEELFRVDASTCVRKNIAEVVRNADLLDIIDRTLENSEPVEGDIFLSEGDRYLQGHGTVLHGEDDRKIGALIVLNDVTRLRKLETMRQDFVANVSHELKTPITSIKGFVDTLIDTPVESEPDRDRFLGIIRKQTSRLQAIIEDLLALADLEHGAEKNEIEFSVGRVGRVLGSAVEACRESANAKGIALEMICDESLTARVNVQLLEQAVVNLIDNAVKYSDSGTHIEVTGRETEQGLAIQVCDEGAGIPRKHVPRLFERFYRVDRARSRTLGGTGLGLAVVKHIALAHNGRVAVESQPGLGSTFSIFLPKTAQSGSETPTR